MPARLLIGAYFLTLALPAQIVIRRAEPVYPPLAKAMRIQGRVRMQAVIDTDGNVAALLVDAAMDAAKRYRYTPLDKPAIVSISITFSAQQSRDSNGSVLFVRTMKSGR